MTKEDLAAADSVLKYCRQHPDIFVEALFPIVAHEKSKGWHHKNYILEFLEDLELLKFHPSPYSDFFPGKYSVVDGPWYTITPDGYLASEIGIDSFLERRKAEREAQHQSNLASIDGLKWNKVSIAISILISIFALCISIIALNKK